VGDYPNTNFTPKRSTRFTDDYPNTNFPLDGAQGPQCRLRSDHRLVIPYLNLHQLDLVMCHSSHRRR
jgi:hypothetical protein